MGFGMSELVLIFVVALLIFGPRKLPEIAKSLGKAMRMFRDASNEMKRTLEEDIRLEEDKEKKTPDYTPPTSTPSDEPSIDDEFMEDYEEEFPEDYEEHIEEPATEETPAIEEVVEEPAPEVDAEENIESADIDPETQSPKDLPG